MSSFVASLDGHELLISLTNGGCAGGEDADLSATLDGVLGTRSDLDPTLPHGAKVFTWEPFPAEPELLELFYENAGALACVNAQISFADAICERENDPEDCPL